MTGNKPAHEIRFGLVRAAIWDNSTPEMPRFSVSINRSYKDGDEWKRTESFNRDDLLLVAKAADQAHSWICNQRNGRPAEVNQRGGR